MAEIAEMNKQLLASNQPGDHRPLSHDHDPPTQREPYTPASMRNFAQAALSTRGGSPSESDLLNVLSCLGLDSEGKATNTATKKNLVKGIRFLSDYHFGTYNEHERADIMGELLFNSTIFSKQASRKVFEKSTRTMTSCIFNAVSLLKAIDSKAGSLNDSAADEYAKIELNAKLSSPKQGQTMLRSRHNITRARRIANGLVAHLFSIEVT